MTRKQAIVIAVLGAVAAVGLVVLHLLMPLGGTWTVARLVHYGWDAAVALGAAGGVVFVMWKRPEPRRRDEKRDVARRKAAAVVALVVGAVSLVAFSEIRRDFATRDQLAGAASDDLAAIGKALDAWAADHDGAAPDDLAALAPRYLDPARLHYIYRDGPLADASPVPEGTPPSYALPVVEPPSDAKAKPPEPRERAYLRPGLAWAPLTVVLEKAGGTRVVGEDEVQQYEALREKAAKKE
jgi:hypothetical protein